MRKDSLEFQNFHFWRIRTLLKTETLYFPLQDLCERFRKEVSGNFYKAIRWFFYSPAELNAIVLHKTMKGHGTKENILIDILCTARYEDIKEITNTFKKGMYSSLDNDYLLFITNTRFFLLIFRDWKFLGGNNRKGDEWRFQMCLDHHLASETGNWMWWNTSQTRCYETLQGWWEVCSNIHTLFKKIYMYIYLIKNLI